MLMVHGLICFLVKLLRLNFYFHFLPLSNSFLIANDLTEKRLGKFSQSSFRRQF